ncbi:hypothetical protein ABK040_010659 [Willaertia magna]
MSSDTFKKFAQALISNQNKTNSPTTTNNNYNTTNSFSSAFENNNLCYGDFISLYIDNSNNNFGFLSVDGINLNCHQVKGNKKQIRCGLLENIQLQSTTTTSNNSNNNNNTPTTIINNAFSSSPLLSPTSPTSPSITTTNASNNALPFLPNFSHHCVFQVHYANTYTASKKYRNYRDQLEASKASNVANNNSTTVANAATTDMLVNRQGRGTTTIGRTKTLVGNNMSNNNANNSSAPTTPRGNVNNNATNVHFSEEEERKLSQFRERMEREKQQNRKEAERLLGKPIFYGEKIQLFHVQTKTYLTVARESAEMQRDCLKLTLDDEGNTYSHFQVLPCFGYQREGEVVKLSDYIRLLNPKSNQFIHSSYFRYSMGTNTVSIDPKSLKGLEKGGLKYNYDNRREVNMSASTSFTKWRLRLYSPWYGSGESDNYLRAGEIVRIFHKELDGYLTVNDKTGRVKLIKKQKEITNNNQNNNESVSSLKSMRSAKSSMRTSSKDQLEHSNEGTDNSTPVNQADVLSCYTLWEIEMLDVTRGGAIKWGSVYRLRNIATGQYLIVKEYKREDDISERESEFKEKQELDVEETSFRSGSMKAISSTDSLATLRRETISEVPTISVSSSTEFSSRLTNNTNKITEKKEIPVEKSINLKKEAKWNLYVESFEKTVSPLNMLFSLHDSTTVGEGKLQRNAYYRVKNFQTASWFHALDTNENSKYIKLSTTNTLKEQDVLTCFPVSESEIDDLFTVHSYLPILQYFKTKITESTVSKNDVKLFLDVLSSCIRFCTISEEIDPLYRTGIPVRKRQQLLRERGVIAIVMDIIENILSTNKLTTDDLMDIYGRPEKQDYYDIIQYGYRFVRQVVLMNEVNGLYMAKYINSIQSMIEYSINASEALLEILSNNYALLNKISVEQIDFFAKLLFDIQESNMLQTSVRIGSLKKAVYLSFLTSLVICEGKTVIKNQRYISNLLFSTFKDKLVDTFIIPKIRKTDKKIIIVINGDELDLISFSKSASEDNGPMYTKPNYERLIFFQEQIKLFAALCNGRSEEIEDTRAAVTKLFTYEIILRCITERNLTPSVRTSFVTLLMHCFVDVDKRERKPLLSLTRKMKALSGGKDSSSLNDLDEVKAFLNFYFAEHSKLKISEIEINILTLSLVRLCRNMLEFGIYTVEDFGSGLLNSLFDMLVHDGNNKYEDTETEDFMVIIDIKLEIVKIFHDLLDIALDRRITMFLQFFWQKYKDDDVQISMMDLSKEEDRTIVTKKAEFMRRIQQLEVQEYSILQKIFENDFQLHKLDAFDSKILELTNIDNLDLATACLRLLIRKYRAAKELSDSLPKIEMIVSTEMAKSFDNLTRRTKELNSVFGLGSTSYIGARNVTEQEVKRAIQSLDDILMDLKENGQRSQRVLRNLKSYETILSVLKKEWIVPPEITEKSLKLLTAFVRNNYENQKIIFPYTELLVQMIGTVNKKADKLIVELLCEIFRNNRALCSVIEEKTIELFIDKIASEHKFAYMLGFLNTILVRTNGNSIKKNQSLITKSLLERKKDVLILFKDEEGMRERASRIYNNEYVNEPDGILRYHIALLHLLHSAADGKNRESEIRLQQLFPYEELLDQVLTQYNISILKDPFCKLIDEVYINTEKSTNDNEKKGVSVHHPLLFRLFGRMTKEVELAVKKDKVPSTSSAGISPNNSPFLTPKNSPNTNTKTNISSAVRRASRSMTVATPRANDEEKGLFNVLVADTKFIYNTMIPFIHNYFHLHFPPPNPTKEQLEIAEGLVLSLIELYKRTASAHYKEKIYKCITAMWKKSMSEASQKAITQFISSKFVKLKVNSQKSENTALMAKDEVIHVAYKRYISNRIVYKVETLSKFGDLGKLYQKHNNFIETLVQVLRKISITGFKTNDILEVGLLGLDIVKDIVADQNEKKDDEESHNQIVSVPIIHDFDVIGNKIVLAVIELITSPQHEIVKSALELGKLILHNGEKKVQDEIFRILTETDSSHFFLSIRDRIRLAKSEIKERKNYLRKKREREAVLFKQEALKIRHKLKEGKEGSQKDGDSNETSEDFVELGFIEDLLEFLRLLCEGHNNLTQTLLQNQPNNRVNVDLIAEIIDYTVALSKKIDADNVNIIIQIFRSLTEFVQGPCHENIRTIGLSPKLYVRCINEIMASSFDDGKLITQQEFEMKKELVLTLISLLEGSTNKEVLESMRFSLNLDYFENIILFTAKFLNGQIGTNPGETCPEVENIQKRLRKDFDVHYLFSIHRDVTKPLVADTYIEAHFPGVRDQIEDLGLHIYFLFNILKDGEREYIRRTISIEEEQRLKRVTNFLSTNTTVLHVFQKQTGNIEVLRGNSIEKIYFPKPKIFNNLLDKARSNYVNTIDITAPQEKIMKLYQDTFSTFHVEMCHYDSMREAREKSKLEETEPIPNKNVNQAVPSLTSLQTNINLKKNKKQKRIDLRKLENVPIWEYIANWWDYIRLLSFFFCVIINVVLLVTYKRVYTALEAKDIPIPGDDSFSVEMAAKGIGPRAFAADLVMCILGVLQLIITASLFLIYVKLFMTLEVKKRFKLDKKDRWESIPRNREFYLKYIKYVLLDPHIWFFILYFMISFIALLVSPIVYSILLFEMILRFPALMDVLQAVTVNAHKLLLTGMLLLVALFFFCIIYFSWFNYDFVLTSSGIRTCDSMLECFITMVDYGFRSGSFWEDLYSSNPTVSRAAADLAFQLIVITILTGVVFGTILDAFDQIRSEREQKKKQVRDICFICALERSKFDMYANEGLTFEKHVKEEHYLWNYVYFLIYLYEKPTTEFTGTEQYIYERCEEDDVAGFFPVFRSKTLESIESRTKNKTLTNKVNGQ